MKRFSLSSGLSFFFRQKNLYRSSLGFLQRVPLPAHKVFLARYGSFSLGTTPSIQTGLKSNWLILLKGYWDNLMLTLHFNQHKEPEVLKQKFTGEYLKLLYEIERWGSNCKLSTDQISIIKQQVFGAWGKVQERLNQGEDIKDFLKELPDFYESFVKKIECPMVERFELAAKISDKEISKGFSMVMAGGTERVLIKHIFKEIKNVGNKVKRPCEEEEIEGIVNDRKDIPEEDIQSVVIQWGKYQGSNYISSVGITVRGSDPTEFHELAPFSYLGTREQIKLNPHRVIRILEMIGLSVEVAFLGQSYSPREVKITAMVMARQCDCVSTNLPSCTSSA